MFTNWFSGRRKTSISVSIDIHSHLLPGIDDGVKTIEESLEVIHHFSTLGFKKLITTNLIGYLLTLNLGISAMIKADFWRNFKT